MKKFLISLVLALTIVFVAVGQLNAAPPNEETWQFASCDNGAIFATFDINTTTLKTSYFHFYNNTSYDWAVPHVEFTNDGGATLTTVWHYNLAPNSSYDYRYTVNFQRLPATDPDDPNSIRYPANYQFGIWAGSNINDSPYN